MKYYKDENNQIYEFNESQNLSVPLNLIEISFEEANTIKENQDLSNNNSTTPTNEDLLLLINALSNRIEALEGTV
jgi:hypothetical protein